VVAVKASLQVGLVDWLQRLNIRSLVTILWSFQIIGYLQIEMIEFCQIIMLGIHTHLWLDLHTSPLIYSDLPSELKTCDGICQHAGRIPSVLQYIGSNL